ncbi:hypothetical protein N9Y17_02485 [Gammaproteobacteria bacterium]|nr:hypothetical protein [Gammaproteobacteria bacterium]
MGSSLQGLAKRYQIATQLLQSTYLWRLFIANQIKDAIDYDDKSLTDADHLVLHQAKFAQVLGCWLSVSSIPILIEQPGQAVSWVLHHPDFIKTSRERLQYHLALRLLSSLIWLCSIFLVVIIGLALFNYRVLALSVPQLFLFSMVIWSLLLLNSLLKSLPETNLQLAWQRTLPTTKDHFNQSSKAPILDHSASFSNMDVELGFDKVEARRYIKSNND